jgi:hypothetical protein
MRSVIIDVITALTGIAVAGLLLHNPAAAEGIFGAGVKGYSGALAAAGGTH